ncbi:MAG TPA: Fur family transcriptional regulator [Gaiellaceae bacterium]|nr:Fur family transcriptional regulator [Gaiellaceae bacterium]
MATSTAWEEYAGAELRRAGSRTGVARNTVIDYLASRDCCVSAQELHDGLRSEGRSVGIASVYRVLDQLAELRLVHRVDLADGVARFEPALPDGEHHHHLVCGSCGRVEPFDDAPLERALTRVAGDRGFTLVQHDVVLHGSCGDCRAA